MNATIHVIHGPNLNLLGKREINIYGKETLQDIEIKLNTLLSDSQPSDKNLSLKFFQSNHEGEIIDYIHKIFLNKDALGVIANLGAYSHTSIAIYDAFLCLVEANVTLVEVHISNIYKRETFRHHSYISKIANAVITGLGTYGYEAALNYIKTLA